jgi:hypothetical protein
LLAFADEVFDFGKVSQKTFSFRDAELTFAAFIAVHNASEIGMLGALEQAIPPEMSVADRSILLMRLGDVLQTTKSKRSRKHAAVVDKIISLQENGRETESLVSVAH